jgi:DNA-binding MarR family transcriptional regulator
MKITAPTNTVIYSIEKAIKSYRKYALKNIQKVEPDITVDQALLLYLIEDNPAYSQVEMAEILFKDYASVTRMIEAMVKKGYLIRITNADDRRRHHLSLSKKGIAALEKLAPVIEMNRKNALEGLPEKEQRTLNKLLEKIIKNCNDQ